MQPSLFICASLLAVAVSASVPSASPSVDRLTSPVTPAGSIDHLGKNSGVFTHSGTVIQAGEVLTVPVGVRLQLEVMRRVPASSNADARVFVRDAASQVQEITPAWGEADVLMFHGYVLYPGETLLLWDRNPVPIDWVWIATAVDDN